MPKFFSGTSGNIYAPKQSNKKDDEPNLEEASILLGTDETDSIKKPSSLNKRGAREEHKTSLELFKEELKRLNQERDEQRNKVRQSCQEQSKGTSNAPAKPQNIPVPLKPDPRCPTTLTLQVNLNAKDRDSSIGGSFDNGDPTTTNLYIGNINPTVNENDLRDIFGKFGPLASIKIMWPRTDEERARNRNSGFVAYMSRLDAERALKHLNGLDLRGYDMKLGWGKTVPLPQNPVYVPLELLRLIGPQPRSGLPFNGRMHGDDVKRGYIVPNPFPVPLVEPLASQAYNVPHLRAMQEAYEDFMGVVNRSTIIVVQPLDRSILDRIHQTIDFVIKEGPNFEAMIAAREIGNPEYAFLYDNLSSEHAYYRWKLYSILHGDDPYVWRTEEFRMFPGGPLWRPPPINPYIDGMPEELIEKALIDLATILEKPKIVKKPPFLEKSKNHDRMAGPNDPSRTKGQLGVVKREMLGDLLRDLDPTKVKIGQLMLFCINHADAAKEIIDCIYESLQLLETPFLKKIARIYLMSDVLHNCSVAGTGASQYREGFQSKLEQIFHHLREYLVNIEDRHKADKFKQKILAVLGAWKEWTLYEDEFIIKLSNILLGIKENQKEDKESVSTRPQGSNQTVDLGQSTLESCRPSIEVSEELDGEQIDDKKLAECLEAKGLSLRWYKTLELSDDEENPSSCNERDSASPSGRKSPIQRLKDISGESSEIRFKASKWETVNPDELAEQVVTISKWEAMYQEEENRESASDSSSDSETSQQKPTRKMENKEKDRDECKRFKREDS